jgi:hypothetical protein
LIDTSTASVIADFGNVVLGELDTSCDAKFSVLHGTTVGPPSGYTDVRVVSNETGTTIASRPVTLNTYFPRPYFPCALSAAIGVNPTPNRLALSYVEHGAGGVETFLHHVVYDLATGATIYSAAVPSTGFGGDGLTCSQDTYYYYDYAPPESPLLRLVRLSDGFVQTVADVRAGPTQQCLKQY